MTELSIPSLSLFNRTPNNGHIKTQAHQVPTTSHYPLHETLREAPLPRYDAYLPPPIYSMEEEYHLARQQRELDYLHSYRTAMKQEGPTSSYRSTLRQSPPQTFGAKRQPCHCESPPRYQPPQSPQVLQTTQVFQPPQTIQPPEPLQTPQQIITNAGYLQPRPVGSYPSE